MTDEQFERHALGVLGRELGVDGLARFRRLHRSRPGDYTKDRLQWQRDLTIKEVLDSIKRRRHVRAGYCHYQNFRYGLPSISRIRYSATSRAW